MTVITWLRDLNHKPRAGTAADGVYLKSPRGVP